ncbi:MAG: tetratricopeptide repeat protein [Lentimicrobiaceae bacterium]|nr:tetratricopeptide repeat protein [Lentimicrobiaceae bacterium]
MRRIQIIMLFFAVLFSSRLPAQDSLFGRANELYNQKDYENAVDSYRQLTDKGYQDAVLYYNLGNAYFKSGQIGYAVLWYERALRLSPDNKDIQYNLAFANQQTVDNIEPIPPFFLKTWLLAVQNLFSAEGWAVLSIVLCIVLIFSILMIILSSKYRLRMLFFTLTCLSLLSMSLSIVFAGLQTSNRNRTDEGIVLQSSVTVKSTPDNSGTDLFTVHEGAKIKITDRAGEWVEVQFDNGNKGWIPADDMEII